MHKIMVLDSDYPAEDNLYGDVFVHTRVKEYQKTCEVKVVSFFRSIPDYTYEGVDVFHAPEVQDVWEIYKEFEPDSVFIHFYNRRLFSFVTHCKANVIIWVHGYEALGWYRRLFNYSAYSFLRNMHSIIIPNAKQMIGLRKLIAYANRNEHIHFVFVSEWMHRLAVQDSFKKIRHFSIIPNPINTDLFRYSEKNTEHVRKILMIRSFSSKKYANDIAVDTILLLSKRKFFNQLQFSIYGRGKLFGQLTEPLKKFENVYLHEIFLPNEDIPAIHKGYGIFLSPTRQDAQGVSMCEAMSGGLVPVTSNNTAIPEFIKNGITGFTGSDSKELAEKIEYLYHNPDVLITVSKNSSAFIAAKCSIGGIVEKELAILPHRLS